MKVIKIKMEFKLENVCLCIVVSFYVKFEDGIDLDITKLYC